MAIELHSKSRDGLYNALATYEEGVVVVKKGSQINMANNKGFKPSLEVQDYRQNRQMVSDGGITLQDIQFNSLSSAATFVTGRVANGLIVWKTEDGAYVRKTLGKGNH